MANTTNFGWETPDDTDLVKDGAAAIRTLGSAIDTSLVDLKGGTTGQVLSKATGTDMDFTWVAQDDNNAIQNAIIDAKGDLIVGTAADTPARLAVGTNGYVLTADSAQTGGVKWAASSSGALSLISATTFSASSAHNVNDVFSSTYDNYLIVLNLDSVSADDYLNLRVRVSGSDLTGGNYNWSLMANGSGGSAFDGGASGSATSYRISYMAAAGTGGSMIININNPFLSKQTNLNVSSVSNFSATSTYQLKSGGSVGNTTSYTGFTILPASGNITGNVKVYGYVNS